MMLNFLENKRNIQLNKTQRKIKKPYHIFHKTKSAIEEEESPAPSKTSSRVP